MHHKYIYFYFIPCLFNDALNSSEYRAPNYSKTINIFFLWRYSPNFVPWSTPMKLSVHFGLQDFRHSVGLLGRVISSSQGLYLYINTEKRTYTHKHQTSML
jgi:hypothetical protein